MRLRTLFNTVFIYYLTAIFKVFTYFDPKVIGSFVKKLDSKHLGLNCELSD